MTRQRRSATQWQQLIHQFEASGQTAADFCAEHGLNPTYFAKRRRMLRQPSKFIAVRKPPPASTPITVRIADVTVHCAADTPPAWIAELAGRLRP